MARCRLLLLACGMLLAGCADQDGMSKYANGRTSSSFTQMAGAKVNPDGTLIERYAPSTKIRNHAPKRSVSSRSEYEEKGNDGQGRGSVADGQRRAIIARGNSDKSDTPAPDSTQLVHAKQAIQTPVIGSDEWKQEEAENARLDRLLDERIKKSICRC